MRARSLPTAALVAAAAALGWLAASGHLNWPPKAAAAPDLASPPPAARPLADPEPCGAATGPAALAAHNQRVSAELQKDGKKPNILVVWGDDIGQFNVSAYNRGMMGYKTPNIDRIAAGGALFTDWYGQQSCTAGRAAFITGQSPIRTGLTKVGLPGAPEGMKKEDPTIATVLKAQGYVTGQFGKNHLGDADDTLPTAHGFDEFFGNLYHLNAEEEPENPDYPKDPAFKKRFGPRGVIHSFAGGKIEDTGPLTRKRMETIDEEVNAKAIDFMERAAKAEKPFFIWWNSTRMHIFTHLKKESDGKTGLGIYADGMVEHDGHVGQLLKKLDDLGVADNTIVMYSTDNGAETGSWPDGGITPFHGEKGTNWEGGHRIPLVVRWPGVLKPGTKFDNLIHHNDWMPTLLAAAGEPDVKEKLYKGGHKANGKEWKVKLDGYNFLPFFKGEEKAGPRNEYFYFGQQGDLNAVRVRDWKVHFATFQGNIATGVRFQSNWPLLINLKADPYEMAWEHGIIGYWRWYADNMWIFVPVGDKIKEFFSDFDKFPYQTGNNLNPSNINYNTIKIQELLKRLQSAQSPRN